MRNWLIVCESGMDMVKVYERTTGELLHTIKSQPPFFNFHRPSAVLINYENDAEMFIKDDKEIYVFELENMILVRRFGRNVLKRPYGMAFDSDGNIVLVDADFRTPAVHTFNKYSGELLKSKPFEPVISECSKSSTLYQLFGDKKVLGKQLVPYEKTKVRFIYACQNSLYVSDLGRSIVFKTSMNGEMELAFGQFGRGRNEFNEPSGIHVESDGSAIVVGDSKNDRLQVRI